MKRSIIYLTGLSLLLSVQQVSAKDNSPRKNSDIIDLARRIFLHKPPRTEEKKPEEKSDIAVLPAAGYTLQTGWAAVLSANAVFKTAKDTTTNISAITGNITYSQYRQVILPIQTYIWTKNNKYNIILDWRFMKYPQYTYGLGTNTIASDGYKLDYSNIHLYQTLLKKAANNLYAGIGYNYDHYWNVHEVNPPAGVTTDFQSYGIKNTVTASGITLNVLYDSRNNPINASRGYFGRIIYRANFEALGSDANWQSVIADLRHYINFPANSRNVLALWNYDWLTTGGKSPYLMLPSTGWDANSNTGRGYIQGRFKGKDMLYFESEYRFVLTNNGLLGGVVYANAESLSEPGSNQFSYIKAGYGAGLRVKLNKFSNTNVAIDYSFGAGGSKGFFVNLGEVF